MKSKYDSTCKLCKNHIGIGDEIKGTDVGWLHKTCAERLYHPVDVYYPLLTKVNKAITFYDVIMANSAIQDAAEDDVLSSSYSGGYWAGDDNLDHLGLIESDDF